MTFYWLFFNSYCQNSFELFITYFVVTISNIWTFENLIYTFAQHLWDRRCTISNLLGFTSVWVCPKLPLHLTCRRVCLRVWNDNFRLMILNQIAIYAMHILIVDNWCKIIKHLANLYMSRLAGKPTLWSLRNVSNQSSLRSPRRLIRADTFRLRGIDV